MALEIFPWQDLCIFMLANFAAIMFGTANNLCDLRYARITQLYRKHRQERTFHLRCTKNASYPVIIYVLQKSLLRINALYFHLLKHHHALWDFTDPCVQWSCQDTFQLTAQHNKWCPLNSRSYGFEENITFYGISVFHKRSFRWEILPAITLSWMKFWDWICWKFFSISLHITRPSLFWSLWFEKANLTLGWRFDITTGAKKNQDRKKAWSQFYYFVRI